MAEFVTLAELEDPKSVGRFTAGAVVFGRMDPQAEVRVVKNDKQGHDNWPDLRVKVTVNGTSADLGALWRSTNGRTYAAGKVDAAAAALMGWPDGTGLLLQEPRDDQPWRVTVVIDRAPKAASNDGGATDGSNDFGTADDPFAEE
jgi:uncharacterized protein (DUF736 family)